MYYKHVVMDMLGLFDERNIPEDLDKELSEINKLAEKAGGMLASRQMIATIVYNYLKDKGDK